MMAPYQKKIEEAKEIEARLPDDLTEEELAELSEEEKFAAENQPYRKTKKQAHDIRRSSKKYLVYWKSALRLVSSKDNLDEFNNLCALYGVAGVDELWMDENLKTKDDCKKYKQKIRRMLEKKEDIISLRALNVSSN